jgi:hypothetical protein
MTQWIITYGILVITAGIIIIRFVKKRLNKKNNDNSCNSCSTTECGGCPLVELKDQLKNNIDK